MNQINSTNTENFKNGYFVCPNCKTESRGAKVYQYSNNTNSDIYTFCEYCFDKVMVLHI